MTSFLSHGSAVTPLSQAEVLASTQLLIKDLSMMVQRDLESHLFYQDDGLSCGLQSFSLEAYTGLEQSSGKMTKIEVETQVNGPIGTCEGYEDYPCFTIIEDIGGQWQATGTHCAFDEDLF